MNNQHTKLVLISGVPGAGKSTYGRWLQQEKGFVYWDLEHETLEMAANRTGFYIGTGNDIGSLLNVIKEKGLTLIIDWGFPATPEYIAQVRALIHAGFKTWWFDGDREATKQSFIKRSGYEALPAFNLQMERIQNNWAEIQGIFQGNIIVNIMAGPNYLNPNEAFSIMFE